MCKCITDIGSGDGDNINGPDTCNSNASINKLRREYESECNLSRELYKLVYNLDRRNSSRDISQRCELCDKPHGDDDLLCRIISRRAGGAVI